MKAVSPLVGFVLTIFVSVMTIGLVYFGIKPAIERSVANNVMSEARGNLELLASTIERVASGVEGSKSVVTLSVSDGEYLIDKNSNNIIFTFEPSIDLGVIGRIGDKFLEKGLVFFDFFNSYLDNSLPKNLVNVSGNWRVYNNRLEGVNGTAYYFIDKNLNGFYVASNFGSDNNLGEIFVSPVNLSGLVLYLTFDEGSGNIVYDYSGNGNNGLVYEPKWTNGRVGKAIEFSKSTSFVNVSNISIGSDITISLWIINNSLNMILPPAPGGPAWGGSLLAYDSSDTIYFIPASDTNYFYKYVISQNKWVRLQDSPFPFGDGGSITYLNGKIYGIIGGGRKTFLVYDIGSNTWNQLNDLPIAVSEGASLTTNGTHIFLAISNLFYSYKPITNTWVQLSNVPFSLYGPGNHIVYCNNSVYAISGGWNTYLAVYNLSTNSWQSLSSSMPYNTYLSSIACNGTHLFFKSGFQTSGAFGVFNGSGWISLPNSPFISNVGGWIIGGDNGKIYHIKGGGHLDFASYSPTTNSWSMLSPIPDEIPATFREGAGIIYDTNTSSLYAIRGYYPSILLKFNLTEYKWSRVNDWWTGHVSQYHTFAYSNGLIYSSRAHPCSSFNSYNPSIKSWSYLYVFEIGDYPTMISNENYVFSIKGGFKDLAIYDIKNKYVYNAFSGCGFNSAGSSTYLNGYFYVIRAGNVFYRIDPSTQRYSSLANLPWSISSYFSYNGMTTNGTHIFLLRGGNYQDFAVYNPSTNSWASLSPTPAPMGQGASLTYNGSHIFAIRGGGSRDFYLYDSKTNQWINLSSSPTPNTIDKGAGMVSIGSYIYVTRGGGYTDFWRFDTISGIWTALTNVPAGVSDGGSLTTDGNYIYLLRGGYTNEVYRYDPSSNSWSLFLNTPLEIRPGGSISYGNGILFIVRGDYNFYWFYNLSSSSWLWYPQPLPATATSGSCMFILNNSLYIARAGGYTDFWMYNITNNSYRILANTPSPIYEKCFMMWDGRFIYLTASGNTPTVYKYDILNNKWYNTTDEFYFTSSPGKGAYAFSGENLWYIILGELKSNIDAINLYGNVVGSDSVGISFYGNSILGKINKIVGKTTGSINWTNIVLVYDGSSMKIYKNGILENITQVNEITTIKSMLIGRGFNGTIDEVMIFNRSLTDDEIKFLYQEGLKKLQNSGMIQFNSQIKPYIAISNPSGKIYVENLRVGNQNSREIKLIKPFYGLEFDSSFRFSKGNHQIKVENIGFNSTSKRPIIRISEE